MVPHLHQDSIRRSQQHCVATDIVSDIKPILRATSDKQFSVTTGFLFNLLLYLQPVSSIWVQYEVLYVLLFQNNQQLLNQSKIGSNNIYVKKKSILTKNNFVRNVIKLNGREKYGNIPHPHIKHIALVYDVLLSIHELFKSMVDDI